MVLDKVVDLIVPQNDTGSYFLAVFDKGTHSVKWTECASAWPSLETTHICHRSASCESRLSSKTIKSGLRRSGGHGKLEQGEEAE